MNPCLHTEFINIDTYVICTQCGIEIKAPSIYNGITTSVTEFHNSSYRNRKSNDRNIFSDLESLDICERIKHNANEIYNNICSNLHRGIRRKAIIFGCVFSAYIQDGRPRNCTELIKLFDIDKCSAMQGLKYIHTHTLDHNKKDRCVLHTTPQDVIKQYLQLFYSSSEIEHEVLLFYDYLRQRSSLFNRSGPQTVASGILWYWIKEHKIEITLNEFKIRTGQQSSHTITRITREIEKICSKWIDQYTLVIDALNNEKTIPEKLIPWMQFQLEQYPDHLHRDHRMKVEVVIQKLKELETIPHILESIL